MTPWRPSRVRAISWMQARPVAHHRRVGELAAQRLDLEIADDLIRHIWAVRNPEKLRPWRFGPNQL
ncbi:hypothetical protein ACWDFR_40855 [Streptomyces sp. 900105755]|uniref:hypothetical protein n=1 Tax=unclassified Streptomyces TaxID=2593676 RepID=UPI00369BA2B1